MGGRLSIPVLIVVSRVARIISRVLSLIKMHSLSLQAVGDYTSDTGLDQWMDVKLCCIDVDAISG
jgi:hypothetical protein